jgi:hypothetical protein
LCRRHGGLGLGVGIHEDSGYVSPTVQYCGLMAKGPPPGIIAMHGSIQ